MDSKPTNKKKSLIGSVVAVIAFIVAFIVVKEFKSIWYESQSFKEASVSVTSEVEKEIQSAKSQATPEKSTTEILIEESQKKINSTLDNSATKKKKLVAASNMFFGAYFLNTRTRPEYCSKLGVNISEFVNEYKKVHHSLFVSAEKLQIMDFKENGRTYNIDKFYSLLSPAGRKVIAQVMKDTAAYLKTNEIGACQSFAQHPAEWAKEADLSKRAPELTQLLLSY